MSEEKKQQTAIAVTTDNDFKLAVFGDQTKKGFLSQIDKPNSEVLFNREASFALQIVTNMKDSAKDFFLKCYNQNPKSLAFAIANVAASGLTLDPSLKLAYLVPMDGKINFWPSWMGKKEKVIQSGLCLNMYAEMVYSNDIFEYQAGTDRKIYHSPQMFKPRGELIGCYAVAVLANGQTEIAILNREEIEKIRRFSKMANTGAWAEWETEMYKKSVINRLFKGIPKLAANPELLSILKSDQDEEQMNSQQSINQVEIE